MRFLRKYNKIILGLLLVIILITFFSLKYVLTTHKSVVIKDNNLLATSNELSTDDDKNKVKVDIKGAIKNPGVYELTTNARVDDVILKSGGILEDADISVINLSKKVFDEMVIIIYTKEEVEKMLNGEDVIIDNIITDKETLFPDIKNDATIDNNNNNDSNNDSNNINKMESNESTNTQSIININTATIDELDSLPGIGNSKAQNIIDYRNINGNFKTIEDIMNVNGIGTAIYEQIKAYITI